MAAQADRSKLVFVTGAIPRPGLMSGPVHLRMIAFLHRHFDVTCASYDDGDASHLPNYYRLPHRSWWWPPGRLGLHDRLRAARLAHDLDLSRKDCLVAAFPFDGLALGSMLKRRLGMPFHVIVHDRHAEQLAQPAVAHALAGADSILSVSDALVDTMRAYNAASHLLYPAPGAALGLVPGFTHAPVGIAGGFDARYIAIAERLGLPVLALGDPPEGDAGTLTTYRPRVARNDDAVRLMSGACAALAVIIPRGSGDYETHSFPSKLLDFARARIPIVIVATAASPVGRWARRRNWSLYIDDENDPAQFRKVARLLRRESTWLEAQAEVDAAWNSELSDERVNGRLLDCISIRA